MMVVPGRALSVLLAAAICLCYCCSLLGSPISCDSSADQAPRDGQPPVSGIADSGLQLDLRRGRRAARSGFPKPKLAQMPRKTTTTSTSTTTSAPISSAPSTEGAPDTRKEAPAEDEGGSEDYEDIGSGKPKPELAKQRPSPKATPAPEDAEVAETGAEEEEEEEEEPSTSTTTTRRPPKTSKPKSKQPAPSARPRTTKPPPKVEEQPETKNSSQDADTSRGADAKEEPRNSSKGDAGLSKRKKPLVSLPFIRPKNASVCIPEAYLEFPRDFIGDKWRGRGLVLVHVSVVCYMFYCLALVCERYFMPSLDEFSHRLGLSDDVAGATLMSAGSSAPELFTAILGVFVAKGDVGTGAIVGSAVFNILFVIGLCAFVSTTTAQLNWWPVLRDSVFYTFTVLVLILFIYDERVTAMESFAMMALYGLYIVVMAHNEALKQQVTRWLQSNPVTAALIRSAVSMEGSDDVFAGSTSSTKHTGYPMSQPHGARSPKQTDVEDDSMYLAACLIIVRHKRLFRSQLRFQAAARYIIVKRQHRLSRANQAAATEVNYFGPETEPLRPSGGKQSPNNQRDRMEAYARSATASKGKFSIVSKDDYEFWNRPPDEHENYYLWLAKIPANYVLHYTIPDSALYPDKYLLTFVISILWTAVFSYVMVWMVTLIGYTLGIPDSVMGVTFLAAGTSVPDCYSSIHAARNGMADMAVSNSIGSNVFDILIGLALPWFIQTAIYPGVVATINSRGVIYSVILLFLSLIVTIYLLNKYEWTLKPRLGLALLIAYGLFIILTCMLEFNLLGHVNPPPCPVP